MPIIVPAILEDNIDSFLRQQAEIFKISGLQRIQIDITDGKYTPRTTVALSDLGVLNPVYEWEGHLMVDDPQLYFFDAKIVGFNMIIFHFEAVKDKTSLPALATELRSYKISPGLGVNPETPIEEILPYLDIFDQILLLGVKPGYQGGPQTLGVEHRVKELKIHAKNAIIEVDGSVNYSNIGSLCEAGAERLAVGSALHSDGLSPAQNFEKLVQLLPKA